MQTNTMTHSILPEFKWTTDRWAVARTDNVEKLYNHWKQEPNRVAVLEDPKLNEDKLVILKKEHLDQLVDSYKSLSSSYSKKMSNTDLLLKAIDLVADLTKTNSDTETLEKAFSILKSVRQNYSDEYADR